MEELFVERSLKHFENLPVWPKFDVFDKNIDGDVPSSRVDSWEQMHNIIRRYRADDGGDEYVFRGHHNFRWFLSPTLERLSGGGIEQDLAKKQLKTFRLSIRGRISDNSVLKDKEEELWAMGQHHGLDTPLLDWSLAPFVALFFAFIDIDPPSWNDKNGDPTNHSRCIFVLNKTFIEELEIPENPDANKYPRIIEPSKDDHGRLVNQAGLFTMAPYGETLESSLFRALVDSKIDVTDPDIVAKYICKIHIPNDETVRNDCLRQLRKMNIHHASLFPDVIGASLYCNELTREFFHRRERAVELAEDAKIVVTVPPVESPEILLGADKALKSLIDSLMVTDAAKKSVKLKDLKNIAGFVLSYANDDAGVDWEERESMKARLRTRVRRHLSKIHFDEDSIEAAANAIVETAAQLTAKAKIKTVT